MPTAAQELQETIRQTVRQMGLSVPLVRDTMQVPVASPTPLPRVGAGDWLVNYQASTGDTPDADTPAWTPHLTGLATGAVADGVLTVTAGAAQALWWDTQPEGVADNAVGNVAPAWVNVTDTSACSLNQGPCLAIADGRFLWIVWLREGGLNIDGEAEVAVTLDDDWHLVVLAAKGETCTVTVDGRELATGGPAGHTTKKAITFGSHVSEAAI